MTQMSIGIDVAKETLDVVLWQDNCTKFKQVENTERGYHQLSAWIKTNKASQAHVCLEATGQYGDGVAEYLYQQGHPVSVVNPARIKHYGNSKLRRNKTDKADAGLIALYCAMEKPLLWSPPPLSFKDLQALVRRLDDMQSIRQQEVNRLKSGGKTLHVIDSLKAAISFFDSQIKAVKKEIEAHINKFPELKELFDLIITIPGIGKLTAAKLLGEIRNIRDFKNARQLAAYSGITPSVFLSGTSVHKKSRISKTGNANLRKALYMPAISAKRHNPIVAAFCNRLKERSGLRPMEIVCAAMRKLLHIVYGVLKSGKPFDPNYLVILQVAS